MQISLVGFGITSQSILTVFLGGLFWFFPLPREKKKHLLKSVHMVAFFLLEPGRPFSTHFGASIWVFGLSPIPTT